MRYALAAVVLLSLIEPTIAAGRIPYGSRAGMEVTVTGVEGIGTPNAVIHVQHTRENAKEFCTEYEQNNSDECVQRTLRETRINDVLRGNCQTGRFITLWGDTLRFAGLNRRKGDFGPKYIIIGASGPLDGSSASGYYTALSEFNALCPGVGGTDP
ncbi:hypothetical protein ACLBX9_02885 [Methylobacterium sp. A49B]